MRLLLPGSLLAPLAACVLLPSQDAFYTQPSNITSYAPGAVIRSRSVETALNGLVANGSSPNVEAAYQYLYRTTDSLGDAVAAVTTLLVPFNADPSKLLAYQTAYDSANNDCSPSYSLQAGANNSATSDIIFITAALDQGWYVATADYEGLQAQYTVGPQAGYATLDLVRATFAEASTSGLSPRARYALWGYSGGSIACEWAAELQPSYAPELQFAGAALGGVIGNVSNTLPTINKGPFSGLAFSGIYGLSKAYPNFTTWLDDNLIPSKKAQFFSIANGCLSQASSSGGNMDLYSYFTRGEESVYDAIPQSVLALSGEMGRHGIPTIPLFIYKAIGDEISPVADTDALYSRYCSQKGTPVSIEYHKDLLGEHISEALTGSASAFSWISDRLNGKRVTNKGCTTEYVALTSLSIETVVSLGAELITILKLLLGGNLGGGLRISG